jgi:hypothetical protein
MWRVAGWAALCLLVLGCGDDDSTGATHNGPLFEFNASENGGRTIRWPNNPIRVFLGNGVARTDEVNVWTAATGGTVRFTFVGSAGAADVTFGFTGRTDICGVTEIVFDEGPSTIVDADVQVSQQFYRSSDCVRTVTHETAHAIGFFGHTSDDGLMDPDGGTGQITPLVSGVLRDLYLLAPGTFVAAEVRRFGLRRPGGKKAMTFIYPLRH